MSVAPSLTGAVQVELEADLEIATYPFDPGVGALLTDNDVDDHAPVWSPLSSPVSRIAFLRRDSPQDVTREVWVVRSDGSSESKVSIDDSVDHQALAWNPATGTEVAYSKYDSATGRYQIFRTTVP